MNTNTVMTRYSYTALTDAGMRIKGTLRAANQSGAVRHLIDRGQHPLELREDSSNKRITWRAIRSVELAVFTRQFACLLRSGMPVVKALSVLRTASQTNQLVRIIEDLEQTLARDGGSLSEAMSHHGEAFDSVYLGLVRSGEHAGKLSEALDCLAEHLGRSGRLKGQLVSAMAYPAFLGILGSAVIAVLMVWVIPRFEELFASFEQDLPALTVALLSASRFVADWWPAILPAVCLAVVGAAVLIRRRGVRLALDRRILRMPLIGQIVLKAQTARLCLTLSALLDGGVSLLSAIEAAGQSLTNRVLKTAFTSIAGPVSAGESLGSAIEKLGLFPPLMVSLVRTGEETCQLPRMLKELAGLYEDQSQRALSGAVRLLEPMLIVLMGGIIAAIVTAVMLPIFSINMMVE